MKRLVVYVEGVPWRRFIVRYRLTDGRRRRLIRYSPGFPWVMDEVGRELMERHGREAIRPGSVSIEEARP